MNIDRIKIKNFRLLQDFSVNVEKNLSLIIGKNNCGKTSFLAALEKFIKKESIEFDDFSISFQNKLIDSIFNNVIAQDNFTDLSLSLRLEIKYFDEDDLLNISPLIQDLEAEVNSLILVFEYSLDYEGYSKFVTDYAEYKQNDPDRPAKYFVRKNFKSYFQRIIKSINVNDDRIYSVVESKAIERVINFQVIHASRNVSNIDDGSSKVLSHLSSKYYKSKNSPQNLDIKDITELQKKILDTDDNLSASYKIFFKDVVDNVKKFSTGGTEIEIMSTLDERDLFDKNTTVRYVQEGQNLPEHYNGLGYMNLFAIIFHIHIKLDEFKKVNTKTEKPADINLLFIEEPEAHTHPQMQYVFIRNIKDLLSQETGPNLVLQTIISSHSSHIVSQSDFEDIKYFQRRDVNNVIAKNLSELKSNYLDLTAAERNKPEAEIQALVSSKESRFRFLKQYLTLNNAELFFADKVVLIEGDTERILLPAMMKKIDNENVGMDNYDPLLSQCISIIEIGNYSQVLDMFLSYLEIKTLIITDIDSADVDDKKCSVALGIKTTNSSIKYFLSGKTFEQLKLLTSEDRVLEKVGHAWIQNNNANLMITYQSPEKDNHARSFEEAFITINTPFLNTHKSDFDSLKNKHLITLEATDYYSIAEQCIAKKSGFASDILFYSDVSFSNWTTPEYMREGLTWLGKP